MKFLQDSKGLTAEHTVGVIVGDRKREQGRLKALAEKYNGCGKILLCLFSPIPKRRGAGLTALSGVEVYAEYNIAHTLFLVDKEHLPYGQGRIREEKT